MYTRKNRQPAGLTIVELLVVISIMALLTALIVPQVRLINKDRNIREAARVVGTALTQARDRAIATGAAGLMIERNGNLFLADEEPGYPVYYAGTRLYLMRHVPNYVDDHGEGASLELNNDGDYVVAIRAPWEQAQQAVIRPGDNICLNSSSVRYLIESVTPFTANATPYLRLGINTDAPLPAPVASVQGGQPQPVPYTIERLPRKIESSVIDLPEGYIIDLRYSGYWNQNPFVKGPLPTNVFDQTSEFTTYHPDSNSSLVKESIELYFGKDGSLDRYRVPALGFLPKLSRGSMDLFVTEYRPEDLINPAESGLELRGTRAKSILSNPASLWVTLSHQTGGVNVGYNEPPTAADRNENPGFDLVNWEIYQARDLSRDRTSASQ